MRRQAWRRRIFGGYVSTLCSKMSITPQTHGRALFRVLPQIKKLLNGDSLLQYAVCLFRTNEIPEEHRARLSQDLLSTAVREVKIYDVIPSEPKSNRPSVSPPRHIDETTNPEQQYSRQRDRAKLWITSCLDLGADDLVRTLSKTPEQSVEVLRSRAREVLQGSSPSHRVP